MWRFDTEGISGSDGAHVTNIHYVCVSKGRPDIKRALRYSQLPNRNAAVLPSQLYCTCKDWHGEWSGWFYLHKIMHLNKCRKLLTWTVTYCVSVVVVCRIHTYCINEALNLPSLCSFMFRHLRLHIQLLEKTLRSLNLLFSSGTANLQLQLNSASVVKNHKAYVSSSVLYSAVYLSWRDPLFTSVLLSSCEWYCSFGKS